MFTSDWAGPIFFTVRLTQRSEAVALVNKVERFGRASPMLAPSPSRTLK